ncbi:MAG: secretin N-terminal domain-containing protein, partial [Plesiomonas shigelloides]
MKHKVVGSRWSAVMRPALVLLAALWWLPASAIEGDNEFSANFKNTDLATFIDTVARNLNKTVITDPSVQGQVNVRSTELLNERQYYQLFLNVLQANGFSAVAMDNGVIKVVKSRDAKTEPLPVVTDNSNRFAGDEMITRVVPVRNVSVRELAPLLRQLIDNAGSGNVVNYDPSNVIMLTGRASVVNRLADVIHRVDLTGNKSNEVVTLQNASAPEMVRVIDSLNKINDQNQPSTLKSQVVADERTNSVVISGDPAVRANLRRLINQLDSEIQNTGNSRVFYLKYSKADDLVEVLNQVSGNLKSAKEAQQGQAAAARGNTLVSIAANKNTNALVVTAPPDIMQSLQSVIAQLDVRRAQVHVEALIVEVAEGNNINFGVQWGSKDAGLVQFANGNQIPIGPLAGALYQAKPEKGSTVVSDNGST